MSSSNIVTLQHHHGYYNRMRYILVFFVARRQNTELVSCESLRSARKSWSIPVEEYQNDTSSLFPTVHIFTIPYSPCSGRSLNWAASISPMSVENSIVLTLCVGVCNIELRAEGIVLRRCTCGGLTNVVPRSAPPAEGKCERLRVTASE